MTISASWEAAYTTKTRPRPWVRNARRFATREEAWGWLLSQPYKIGSTFDRMAVVPSDDAVTVSFPLTLVH